MQVQKGTEGQKAQMKWNRWKEERTGEEEVDKERSAEVQKEESYEMRDEGRKGKMEGSTVSQ